MLTLKNAHILTMTGKNFDNGTVIIDNGKIIDISGEKTIADRDQTIDLHGKWLMPGMVDAHSHIGMWEDGLNFEGADGNEMTDPATPQLRAIDGINPLDRCFEEAYQHGVTTVVTGPGSANVIGGTFVALKTKGRRIEDMVIKDPVALKVAFGENPKTVYAEQKKTPMTRMATAAILREALMKAQEYDRKIKYAGEDLSKMPDFNLKYEVLCKVLHHEIPLKAHAHRADDILTAMRIAKEFDVDITLDHCTEGYMIADILKNENMKVIIGPLLCDRSKPELKNLSIEAPRILEEAGVKFALMTDHPVTTEPYLIVAAAICASEGLSDIAALQSITINAAQITGIDQRVGSIEVGKDADIAVFSGYPLDIRSKCELVLIDGNIVYDAKNIANV